jgi:CubicO group peptidase (beta-lactamase class C family)
MTAQISRLTRAYRAAARSTPFSGVVALEDTRTGAWLFTRTAGWANRAERIPNRLNTRFASASGSKLFTAVAALQLVEEGLLRLDSPAADIIEGFPFGRAATLRHLLTHTSGLPDYFDETGEQDGDYASLWADRPVYRMDSARDFLPMFYARPVLFNPGERFSYNNAGFLLLELIIERASGEAFRQRVQRRVFDTAGMSGAGYFYADRLPGHTALGYLTGEMDARTNLFALPYIGGGDGGAYASAQDWSQFWKALLNGRLLGPDLLAQMLSPQAPAEALPGRPGRQYGLGVWLNLAPLRPAARAVGSDPGVEMVSACLNADGLQLSVLSNQSDGAGAMFWALLEAL